MKVRRPASSRRGPALTPLIDVVFILIVFVLLAATFDRPQQVEIAPPSSSQASAAPERSLEVTLDAAGAVTIEGAPTPNDALRATFTRHHAEGGERPVLVRADAQADLQSVLRVLDAARAGGFEAVSVAARGGDAP